MKLGGKMGRDCMGKNGDKNQNTYLHIMKLSIFKESREQDT